MNEFLKYFSGETTEHPSKESSGKYAERAFSEIYGLTYAKHQSSKNRHRYDFETDYVIYEVKNIWFGSTGTADEKLMYDCWKYAFDGKDVIIVLCADMEHKFEKQLKVFTDSGNLELLMEHNVTITRFSDIIADRYFRNQYQMIKWVGSKQSILDKLIRHFPTNYSVYIEPFVGSGCVFEAALDMDFEEYYVNDSNSVLIELLRIIKNNPARLIEQLHDWEQLYNESDPFEQETIYYSVRAEYNKQQSLDLFMFLNKTSFRGLYRVNKKNEFNVPFGNYRQIHFNIDAINRMHCKMKNKTIRFSSIDYRQFLSKFALDQSMFIYLDPPYQNSFDSYCANSFSTEQFKQTIELLPCKLLISNSSEFSIDGFSSELIEVQDKINSRMPDSIRIEQLLWN